jgi:hypothetical protein
LPILFCISLNTSDNFFDFRFLSNQDLWFLWESHFHIERMFWQIDLFLQIRIETTLYSHKITNLRDLLFLFQRLYVYSNSLLHLW